MKKLFFMALAVVAISFASCGNKAQQKVEEAVDSTEAVVEDVNAAADEAISALTEQIEKNDASALQTTLESIKAKIASFIAANPELAKEYLGKVQNFLKENADKIKAVVGTNAAVTALVDGIANLPSDSVEKLTGATEALKALGIDAGSLVKNAAADAVEGAADAVENVKDAAKETVENAKEAVADKANEAVQDAKDKAGEAVDKGAAAVKKGLGI
jgi:vacuolar-type H+-ATPase subunit H